MTIMNREEWLDNIVSDIAKLPDHMKIYKAAKSLNRKTFQNLVVMDSQNKLTTSPTAIYDITKGHFHTHFYYMMKIRRA